MRLEVAVAAEQLGVRDALKLAKKYARREKDPAVAAAWLRALGAVADDDKSARKLLLSESEDEDPLRRRNALFALGGLPQGDDVRARLMAALESTEGDDVRAAACAMALSRDEAYLPVLRKRGEMEGVNDAAKETLTTAVEVIEGDGLARLESAVRECCRDRVARERVFFRQVSAEMDGGGRGGGGRGGRGGRGGQDGGDPDDGDGDGGDEDDGDDGDDGDEEGGRRRRGGGGRS